MTDLRRAAEDYLALRRSLGFKLASQGYLLESFVSYAEQAGASRITVELAVAWARLPSGRDPVWHARRLSAVRVFAKHLTALDPTTEVPPADLLPYHSRRAVPYLYTPAEIDALMAAARGIRSPLKAATYETVVGLLVVTGMRVGEAIALDRKDVDWKHRLLTVVDSKFGKSRELPLHASTVAVLRAYARRRDRLCPRPKDPSFFVSTTGTRLIYNNVHMGFHKLVRQVGLKPRSPRCRPRLHDVRHSFAVTT
ncbi:MAG: tyrosine-type recombinase/integrase, partial [Dehalococcoidia bacterium]